MEFQFIPRPSQWPHSPGWRLFIAINIEPLVGARIPRCLGGLESSARNRDEHLAQRMIGEHALDDKRFIAAVQPGSNQLVVSVVRSDGGLLRAVKKSAAGNERRVIHRRVRRAFRQTVVGMLPRGEFLFVTWLTTGRAAVGSESLRLVREVERLGVSGIVPSRS